MFKFGTLSRQKFKASTALDADAKNTVLLLKGGNTAVPMSEDNNTGYFFKPANTVIDNNMTVDNPFGHNWSYFNNPLQLTSSAYMYTVDTTVFSLGQSDFTVEFFCKFTDTSLQTVTRKICSQGLITDAGFQISVASTATTVSGQTTPTGGLIFSGVSDVVGTRMAVNDNKWHHIIFVKSGVNMSCYVDGIMMQTVVFAYNFLSTQRIYWGAYYGSTSQGGYQGWISNFRVVVGFALYTAPVITVPTTTLTAVQGTQFLNFHRSISTVDASPYYRKVLWGYEASQAPYVAMNPVGPFAIQEPQSVSWFDADGGASANITHVIGGQTITKEGIGTKSFTISMWLKYPGGIGGVGGTGNVGSSVALFDMTFSHGRPGYWGWDRNTWGIGWMPGFGPPYDSLGWSTLNSIFYQEWAYIHLQRDTTVTPYRWTLWINGVKYGTNTYTNTLGNGCNLSGSAGGYGIHVGDLRVSLGCVYSESLTNIPVPTEPFTYSNYGVKPDQVILKLWDKNSINWSRFSTNKGLMTNQQWSFWQQTNPTYPPAISSFSPYITQGWSASISNTQTNGYIQFPTGIIDVANNASNSGVGHLLWAQNTDWTMEFWFYLNALNLDNILVSWNGRTASSDVNALQIKTLSSASNVLSFIVGSGSTTNYNYSGGNPTFGPSISTATWYHLAVTSTGTNLGTNVNTGTMRAYLNGVEITPAGGWMTTPNRYSGTTIRNLIGSPAGPTPQANMNGYISNFRFVRGVGLYTGNFAVPTGTLRTIQNAGKNIVPLSYYNRSTNNSIYFNGGSASQTVYYPTNFVLSDTTTSNFTIEFWLNPQDNVGTDSNAPYITLSTNADPQAGSQQNGLMIASSNLGANDLDIQLIFHTGWVTAKPVGWPTAAPYTYASTQRPIKKFQWSHIALTRYNNTYNLFVNGQLITVYNTVTNTSVGITGVRLGSGSGATYGIASLTNGMYMSNVRIISNQAIYTGTFTVQAVAFSTSTVGMSGVNIASTLTGYVSFLGAQTLDFPFKAFTQSASTFTGFITANTGTVNLGSPNPYSYIPQAVTALNSAWWEWNGTDRSTWFGTSTELITSPAGSTATPKMYPFAPIKVVSNYNNIVTAGSVYIPNQSPSSSLSSLYLYHGVIPHNIHDFTVEFYFYIDAGHGGARDLYSMGTGANNFKIVLTAAMPALIQFQTGAGTVLISSIHTVIPGAWYHVAVSRFNGTSRLFLNGRLQGTYADATQWRTDSWAYPRIGNTAAGDFYVAGFRQTWDWALYTTDFNIQTVVPTRSTGTFILANFDTIPSPYDASMKSALQIAGEVSQRGMVSPYGNSISWYFDGYNDFMLVTGTTYTKELSFEYDDFTAEMWIWPQAYNLPNSGYVGSSGIILYDTNTSGDATGNGRFAIYLQTPAATTINTQTMTTASIAVTVGGLQAQTNHMFGGSVSQNTWTHIVVQRKALVTTIYQNGRNVGERTDPTFYNISTNPTNFRPVIATSGNNTANNSYHGYIANMRITKGFAIYSTSTAFPIFPVPTAPMTTTTAATTNTIAVGYNYDLGARSYKFGGATAVPASYLHLEANNALNFPGDFTVEGWFKHNVSQVALSTSSAILISTTATAVGTYTLQMQTGTTLSFFDGDWHPLGTVSPSTWNHFALTRKSGLVTGFLNGAYIQPWYNTSTVGFNFGNAVIGTGRRSPYIGVDSTLTQFTGYMSNIRMIGESIYNPPVPTYSTSIGFPGTVAGLSIAHNSLLSIASGASDTLTIEGWWYWSTVTSNSVLFDKSGVNPSSFANYQLTLNASNFITLTWGASGAPGTAVIGQQVSTVVPVINMWHHIAFVKSNADWAVFYDGQRIISYSGLNSATDNNASALRFGTGYSAESNSAYFRGYISNIRINRNTTGPYSATTSTITVPYLNPLTTSTGYVLLTANALTFTDVSTSSLTVTPGSGVVISSLHPYRGIPNYLGYVMQFPGSYGLGGSRVVVTDNPNLRFGGSDFSIDFWYLPFSFATASRIFEHGTGATDYSVEVGTTGQLTYLNNSVTLISNSPLTRNLWNYCVITKISNNWQMWVNGVQVAAGAINNTNGSGAIDLTVGSSANGANYILGNLAYLRFQYGAVPYYGVIPTTVPVATTQTVLLLTGTATGIRDISTVSTTATVVNTVTVITTMTPFINYAVTNYIGGSAQFVDATSSMLVQNTWALPSDNAFASSVDGTVEFWFYRPNSVFAGVPDLAMQYKPAPLVTADPGDPVYQWSIAIAQDGTLTKIGNETITTSTVVSLNAWHHVAYVKNSGIGTLFYDGQIIGQVASTYDYGLPVFRFGYWYSDDTAPTRYSGVQFYISNFRYIYNRPAYAGAFTPVGPLGTSQSASGNYNAVSSTQTQMLLFTTSTSFRVDSSLYSSSTVVTESSATIFPVNFAPFSLITTGTGATQVFSPSTSTLTVYGTATVLLTANSSTYMDSSPRNIGITYVGTSTDILRSTNPFAPIPGLITMTASRVLDQSTYTNVLWASGDMIPTIQQPFANYNLPTQINTRSLYFDGTNDFLTIRDQGYHRFSSGPFTIEGWFYMIGTSGGTLRTIISKGNNTSAGWSIDINANNKLQFTWLAATPIPTASVIDFHRWNHFVVQRTDMSTQGLKIFINGVLQATGFCGVEFNESDLMYVGVARGNSGQNWIGFIDDIRITKSVRYTVNVFDPPTTPYSDRA